MGARERVRVLVVEDDYLVSEMVRGLLEGAGYVVVGEAGNGLEAVEMTKSLQPDVVLMDIAMPDMDGIEATRLIYERCPTPVVALTAHEMEELVVGASKAGVGAYLVKPPKLREMERAITIARARFDDMMELRCLNADLQAQNEDLDAFAHTVAHDLKGPLALIVGFAEILKEEYATLAGEALRSHLQKIVFNGRKMSNIIDELLVLAGVRQMEVEMRSLDMASIVSEAMERLAEMIEKHQAEIILPDTWPAALGYGPWIEEVWVNYLSNGIKYGGRPEDGIPPRLELGFDEWANGRIANERMANGRIANGRMANGRMANTAHGSQFIHSQFVIRASVHSHIRFWVRDNGAGIPPEAQRRLFTPFVRLDQIHVRGYGLGLSIVRRIVEKLGGQVGVESEVGQGSVFTFTLPSIKE
ncbi:MAG: response regulator [Chloroflexota bacterium]|nr:response regulator [Chloroflexota bacterium]